MNPRDEFFNRISQNFSSKDLDLINDYWQAAGLDSALRQSADSGRVGDEDLQKWFNGAPRWGYIKVPNVGKELVEREEAERRIAALEAALAAQGQGEYSALSGACKIVGPKEDVQHILKIIGEPDDHTAAPSAELSEPRSEFDGLNLESEVQRLVDFFRSKEGYRHFGREGDRMNWTPAQTAVNAMQNSIKASTFQDRTRPAARAMVNEDAIKRIAEETMAEWGDRVPLYSFDFRGLIADGIRRALAAQGQGEADAFLVQVVKDGEAWEHKWYVPRWGDPDPSEMNGKPYSVNGVGHPEMGTYRVKAFAALAQGEK